MSALPPFQGVEESKIFVMFDKDDFLKLVWEGK